jgi:hypothetical protein
MHALNSNVPSVVKEYNGMILEVIRAVNIKSSVFRNVTLCSLVSGYKRSPEIVFNMMVKTTASFENTVYTYQIKYHSAHKMTHV